MSTAILISGQMRTFAQCYPNIRWMVFRHFEDPVFFVSCVKDEQSETAQLLKNHYSRVFVEYVEQPQLEEPDAKHAEHAPFAISVPIQAVLRQLWHLNRVWEFTQEFHRELSGCNAVVRCRPDLWFHRFSMPPNFGIWPEWDDTACTPYWGTFGGVNDRFAVMGRGAAKEYFTTYAKIPKLLGDGCPLHPESLVSASLQEGDCTIRPTLLAEFSKFKPGTSGHRWPEHQFPDIFAHTSALTG